MKEFCVDLELAKELKENGFPQDTDKVWYKYGNPLIDEYTDEIVSRLWANNYKVRENNIQCSAPISDEILKELPPNSYCGKDKENFICAYLDFEEEDKKKLSNALAKMWLYLKKAGYIK